MDTGTLGKGAMQTIHSRRARRGTTTPQVALIVVLLCVALLASIAVLGTRTRTSMNAAASNAGDPSTLVTRFGS